MKRSEIKGSLETAAAYACWGLLTIFWDLLAAVNSVCVLAHRIIWSMVFMALYMTIFHKWPEVSAVIREKKKMAICLVCGVLITINWGVYIYAVSSGHVLDASMGYFIEPVLVAFMGFIVFRERPSAMERVTFVCAAAALVYMLVTTGTFPVLALVIAGSFAVYGAVKKKLEITPHASLFLETLCMTPFALAAVAYMEARGIGAGGVLHGAQFALLPVCGIVTSIPLLLFSTGVREIPYYLSGILMYINPTLQFLTGLLYFHEELDTARLVAFVIIWIGILFTVWEKMKEMSRARGIAEGNHV